MTKWRIYGSWARLLLWSLEFRKRKEEKIMKRKFLLGVGLSFLIAGCSSSQKIETSLNGKYFEADESELVDNLSKSISNDFKPEIIEEKGGKYLTLNSIDEKDGYTAIVMETNSIDKVEHILINTYVENPSADINEFEKKYGIFLLV